MKYTQIFSMPYAVEGSKSLLAFFLTYRVKINIVHAFSFQSFWSASSMYVHGILFCVMRVPEPIQDYPSSLADDSLSMARHPYQPISACVQVKGPNSLLSQRVLFFTGSEACLFKLCQYTNKLQQANQERLEPACSDHACTAGLSASDR